MHDPTDRLHRFIAELRRRRMFRVIAVYLVVGWLLIQVAGTTFAPLGLPAWALTLVIVLVALGFVIACALGWVYDFTGRGIERTAPASFVGSPAASAPRAAVAVLPFADLSEAHDQDYFCDGLAEEILNALARVRGLHVASRTSSFRFRDGNADAREIGRALDVGAIMEGSVRKSGDRVRVTAQLIDAGNGYHLWSENFDRRLEDIFAIQEEIARNVVRALQVTLHTPDVLDLGRRAPSDMRAYEFYLRGRQIWAMKSTGSWKQAPEMFRRAIELAPDYAQAHAGLADSLAHLLLWRQVQHREGLLDEAMAASRRALELAPELAEAHVAHGNTLMLAEDSTAAVAEFEAAIACCPDYYEGHYCLARTLLVRGEYARAVDEFEAAHRARPEEFQSLAIAVGVVDRMGDRQRARAMAARALERALAEAECDPENERALYFAGGLQVRLGDSDAGRRNLEAALRLKPDDFGTLYNVACSYATMGEDARALDLLERAMATGGGFREWVERDPDFAGLRDDPRFLQIIAKMPRQ